jgi:hypothetical protein
VDQTVIVILDIARLVLVAIAASFGSTAALVRHFGRREDIDRAEIARLKENEVRQDRKIEDLEIQVKTLTALMRANGHDPNQYSAAPQAG